MKSIKKLTERWSDRLPDLLKGFNGRGSPEQFKRHLDEYTKFFSQFIHSEASTNKFKDKSISDITNMIESGYHSRYNKRGPRTEVMNSYNSLHGNHEKLRDLRKQEDWASLRDHIRTLFFRMLTGVGIAGIVLATYWFASKYKIPLPSYRLPF